MLEALTPPKLIWQAQRLGLSMTDSETPSAGEVHLLPNKTRDFQPANTIFEYQ